MAAWKKFAVAAAAASLVAATPIPDVSDVLQNVLKNTDKSDAYTYPTDFTQGIIPKPFHSHNDYWRDIPFYTAISYGAVSVEADVWLINGTLYVGHEQSALTSKRTFDSLYINPILDTLKRENPVTEFVPSPTRNGIYDTSSEQTVYLFVDVKTDGDSTWPVILDYLQPLLDKDYLTTYNGTGITDGPITVVGTGNTPYSYFQSSPGNESSPRYTFYDAPLASLNETDITAEISPIASTDFAAVFGNVVAEGLNDTQLATLKEQIAAADAKGIATRYWDQPGWPIGTRNAIWRQLMDAGVGLLNADDVAGVAGFWETAG